MHRCGLLLCFFATTIHRAVAAANAVAAEQEYLNIFVAFDKEKYMAEALASMRQSYNVGGDGALAVPIGLPALLRGV